MRTHISLVTVGLLLFATIATTASVAGLAATDGGSASSLEASAKASASCSKGSWGNWYATVGYEAEASGDAAAVGASYSASGSGTGLIAQAETTGWPLYSEASVDDYASFSVPAGTTVVSEAKATAESPFGRAEAVDGASATCQETECVGTEAGVDGAIREDGILGDLITLPELLPC